MSEQASFEASSWCVPMKVPYEKIDCEIRSLVRLLNGVPGVATVFSCAGHGDRDEAYITFTAASQDALAAVLRALPFFDVHGSLVGNTYQWQCLTVSARMDIRRRLVYDLRLSGSPQFAQRQLIGLVEASLVTPAPKHPSYSKCVSSRRRDRSRSCS